MAATVSWLARSAHTVRQGLSNSWGPSHWLQPTFAHIAQAVGVDRGAFLDPTCDDGWLCLHVAAGHPELDAIGLTSDPLRLERAERNKGRRLNVTFKDLRPEHVTFPDGTFTAAATVGGVTRWTDTPGTLAELHRVLAEGAHLYLYDPLPDEDYPASWLQRAGGWPSAGLVRAHLAADHLDDDAWQALKQAVRDSPFGGGEEGRHGPFRRLVLTR